VFPSGRDTLEEPGREGFFGSFRPVQINTIVRIMYIMLNNIQTVCNTLISEFRREPHGVDEPRRIFLTSHLVFHVLDIGGESHVTVDDKPVIGFGDL